MVYRYIVVVSLSIGFLAGCGKSEDGRKKPASRPITTSSTSKPEPMAEKPAAPEAKKPVEPEAETTAKVEMDKPVAEKTEKPETPKTEPPAVVEKPFVATGPYATKEAIQTAENYLLFQTQSGGWPRNVDLGSKEYSDEEKAAFRKKYFETKHPGSRTEDTNIDPTLLGGSTVKKLYHLANVYVANGKTQEHFKRAIVGGPDPAGGEDDIVGGLEYILRNEGRKGGYLPFAPQPSFKKNWHKNILLTEDVMFDTANFLREVAQGEVPFDWIDPRTRKAAGDTVQRLRDLLVKIQIRVHNGNLVPVRGTRGELIGWSEQHAADSLTPAWGRDIEPRSASPKTTALAVRWLMSFDDPTPEEKIAIHAGVAWLDQCLRMEGGVTTLEDKKAYTQWATYVELGSGQPLFADFLGYKTIKRRPRIKSGPQKRRRGGPPRKKEFIIEDVPVERFYYRIEDVSEKSQQEVVWFAEADRQLLQSDYPAWAAEHDPMNNSLRDKDQDELPDVWEKRYGLNPKDPSDGRRDSDKDGVSNFREYQAATHPTISIIAAAPRFYPKTTVTINSAVPKGVVRYSTDGFAPDKKGRRYRSPFPMRDSATIKATAFVGDHPVPVEMARFERVGMISHLPFDETPPSAFGVDEVTNLHAQLMFMDLSDSWVTGFMRGSLDFIDKKKGPYVTASLETFNPQYGSISMWVLSRGGDGDRYLFNTNRYDDDRIAILTRDNKLAVCLGGKEPIYVGKSLPKSWSHIVLTWNKGKYVVYRDGRQITTGNYKDFSTSSTIYSLGGGHGDLGSFDGQIDDVRIYNVAIERKTLQELKAEAKKARSKNR